MVQQSNSALSVLAVASGPKATFEHCAATGRFRRPRTLAVCGGVWISGFEFGQDSGSQCGFLFEA